ncbi:sugar ABC transporter permease [Georgenia halophila]|uniref:Sugar ABC transporter permease n=1 Tax=Georgenia halophila TaxID=620889 RepID=A0ABP8LCW0_9MICO
MPIAIMLLPCFALLAVFVLVPLGRGIQLSVHSWDGVSPTMDPVGLGNFAYVWTDLRFLQSLGRTLVWWVMHLFLAVGGALFLAALINEIRWPRARTTFRSLAFLPNVLALSVVGVIWGQIFHPSIGLLNEVLGVVGLEALGRAWLGDQALALGAVGVASAWQAFGFYLVILLAGMQTIDATLYQSAMLDGAGSWQRFRHITLPSLYNTMSLVLVLAFVNALKGFGTVWAMTGGGPSNATELAAVYVWRQAFQSNDVGTASAAGLSIAVIAIVVTFGTTWWRDRAAERR